MFLNRIGAAPAASDVYAQLTYELLRRVLAVE